MSVLLSDRVEEMIFLQPTMCIFLTFNFKTSLRELVLTESGRGSFDILGRMDHLRNWRDRKGVVRPFRYQILRQACLRARSKHD